jgi:hypothetical protein
MSQVVLSGAVASADVGPPQIVATRIMRTATHNQPTMHHCKDSGRIAHFTRRDSLEFGIDSTVDDIVVVVHRAAVTGKPRVQIAVPSDERIVGIA